MDDVTKSQLIEIGSYRHFTLLCKDITIHELKELTLFNIKIKKLFKTKLSLLIPNSNYSIRITIRFICKEDILKLIKYYNIYTYDKDYDMMSYQLIKNFQLEKSKEIANLFEFNLEID